MFEVFSWLVFKLMTFYALDIPTSSFQGRRGSRAGIQN